MPNSTNPNEAIFDQRFRGLQETDYEDVSGAPGRRDYEIERHLLAHGLQGARCLDIGPGTGRWLQFLRRHGANSLCAVDISTAVLDLVAPLGVECRKVDVENESLPFPADSFDVVIAFMVLEHLKQPGLFIREVLRVTRPGGLILMSIPNITSLQSRVRVMLGRLPVAVAQDPTHVGFYTIPALKHLFDGHGAGVEIIPTGFSLNPFNRRSMQVRSNRWLAGLDDNRLFRVRPVPDRAHPA